MKEDVRRATERADAMEAATAFLQSDDADFAPTTWGADDLSSLADERRMGARCVHGSVALVNVPAINGGAVHAQEGHGGFVMPAAPNSASGGGGGGGQSGGKKVQRTFSWGRSKPPPANPSGAPVQQSPGPAPAPTPSKGKLRRSLSFGNEPRRAWGSAAA